MLVAAISLELALVGIGALAGVALILTFAATWAQINDARRASEETETSAGSAVFVGADLSGAKFPGATLTFANLPNARLVNAVFDDADLTRANLADAELKGASFIRADLSGADLSGTDVTESQLRDATTDACTRLPWRRRVSARCGPTGTIG